MVDAGRRACVPASCRYEEILLSIVVYVRCGNGRSELIPGGPPDNPQTRTLRQKVKGSREGRAAEDDKHPAVSGKCCYASVLFAHHQIADSVGIDIADRDFRAEL